MLEELNVKRELVTIITKRKMTYFGHAMRHQHCSLMKAVMLGKTKGKRSRGRHKISHLKHICDWCKKKII